MAVGLSSYAFQRRSSVGSPRQVDLFGMIDETAELGAGVFQICDEPALDVMSHEDLARLHSHATVQGVRLEVGTRGISPNHLMRYLDLAERHASFVRSMLHSPDHWPSNAEAIQMLQHTTAAFADRGVTLGLETYEQVATADLVATFLGICLDPANTGRQVGNAGHGHQRMLAMSSERAR